MVLYTSEPSRCGPLAALSDLFDRAYHTLAFSILVINIKSAFLGSDKPRLALCLHQLGASMGSSIMHHRIELSTISDGVSSM